MLVIMNSLNDHNFPIFEQILMILVSKFMVHRIFYDKAFLSLGLLSLLTTTKFKIKIGYTGYLVCLHYIIR